MCNPKYSIIQSKYHKKTGYIFMIILGVYTQPVLTGMSPWCSPSLLSLNHSCVSYAEQGNWVDQLHVNVAYDHEGYISGNDFKLACIRAYSSDTGGKKTFKEAREVCGSQHIEYSGISSTPFGLYDHVAPNNYRRSCKFIIAA